MAANQKVEAALEWAKGWPNLDGYLKLNALITDEGEAAMNVVSQEHVTYPYIDGTAVKRFVLQLRIVVPWSDGYDAVNSEAANLAADWQDWVSKQYRLGNVPDWDAEIISIEPQWNVPALNAINQDEGLAEYIIQAIITYEE